MRSAYAFSEIGGGGGGGVPSWIHIVRKSYHLGLGFRVWRGGGGGGGRENVFQKTNV